jgi:hypothetical protein
MFALSHSLSKVKIISRIDIIDARPEKTYRMGRLIIHRNTSDLSTKQVALPCF